MSAINAKAVPVNAVINRATGEPVTAAQAFAAWLQQNEPALFNALAAEAAKKSPGLGDWSSILSSIGSGVENVAGDLGSGISSAASSVGDYLTSSQGLSSLTSLANTYLQSQTAQSVAQVQLSRAQQGLAPAPVSYATNSAGQVVPVYTGVNPALTAGAEPVNLGNGQVGYTLGASQLSSLGGNSFSTFLQAYGLPLALGVGGILVLWLLMSRRR